MTFKPLGFENFRDPEVVGSSSYKKNIDAKFTHSYRPSLCWEIVVDCHNLGRPTVYILGPKKDDTRKCTITQRW